jgi:cytokinin riboside 5'-monophosphate phosphoribohydrolase
MNVCVFCSSSNEIAEVYRRDARSLGEMIGKKSYTLVYGGANMGLMQECATAVKSIGGTVVGIVPDTFRKKVEQKVLDQVFFVADLAERKEMMMEYADVFVALPGGFGTLDEVFEVLALNMMDTHQKKLIFLNTNGFYSHLLAHIEHCIQEKCIQPSLRNSFFVANSVTECLLYVEQENAVR